MWPPNDFFPLRNTQGYVVDVNGRLTLRGYRV